MIINAVEGRSDVISITHSFSDGNVVTEEVPVEYIRKFAEAILELTKEEN